MIRIGNPVPLNKYGMRDPVTSAPGWSDTTAKEQIFPDITGAGVFVTIGQSRIANISAQGSSRYTPTNRLACINLNPYDGLYYVLNDPALGASVTVTNPSHHIGWHGRLADKLINAEKYEKVVVIPIAIGGTYVSDWEPGGKCNMRITSVCKLLTGLGITPTAWLWQQGTADAVEGRSQSAYQTSLRAVISYARGLTGRANDPWMIAKDTIHGTDNSTSAAVRAAQASVAADTNNFLGPDVDALTYPTNSDGTHFNDTGNNAVAGLWSTAIQGAF